MRYCLKCKHLSPSESDYCVGCGGSFLGKRCPNGHLSPESATHCRTCGEPVQGAYAPSIVVEVYLQWFGIVAMGVLMLLHMHAAWVTGLEAGIAVARFLRELLPIVLYAFLLYWLLGRHRRHLVPVFRLLGYLASLEIYLGHLQQRAILWIIRHCAGGLDALAQGSDGDGTP